MGGRGYDSLAGDKRAGGNDSLVGGRGAGEDDSLAGGDGGGRAEIDSLARAHGGALTASPAAP